MVTRQDCYALLKAILYCAATYFPSQTIHVRHADEVRHCWWSKDELISDVCWWTPSHGRTSVRRLARIYILQLCVESGCCLDDQSRVMDERDGWEEKVRELRSISMTWWGSHTISNIPKTIIWKQVLSSKPIDPLWSPFDTYIKNKVSYWWGISIDLDIGDRVFANRLGFNPRSSHTKDSKNGIWCRLA